MAELLLKDEIYTLVGAAMEVYNVLGNGFLEGVYQEAYEIELSERAVPFRAQVPLRIHYKDRILKKEYKADIIAFEKVVVELKAQERLTKADESQLLNYLNATKLQVGLIINFLGGKGIRVEKDGVNKIHCARESTRKEMRVMHCTLLLIYAFSFIRADSRRFVGNNS